ncbi:MAG: DUF512 domain-containing protein [Clostridia bacterium]|nr:DUF512 domain-containing protein [Clostridia bacterium]
MAVKEPVKNVVIAVEEGSIAEELGVVPGDILLAINGEPVKDVFDYRMRILDNSFTMTFELHDDGIQTVEIEKDDDEHIGLVFENELMDECMSCHNNCIFCFIAQLPKNMRETLYFKDDDVRMSFLTGNYVTLTNLNEEEFERMLSYRLSPVNVSVHTTNPELRVKMLRNKHAGKIMERLRRIAETDVDINCQFVLCPGFNDGEELERSLEDLATLGDSVKSIACVPIGKTKFRKENNLTEIDRYNKETASAVLDIVEKWQKRFLEERGTRLFYAGDEFYIRAEREIPDNDTYEDFPQLENGVGMIADFLAESRGAVEFFREYQEKNSKGIKGFLNRNKASKDDKKYIVYQICGTDAAPYNQRFEKDINEIFDIDFRVQSVVNEFFGHEITVTGLLTGGDICNHIEAILEKDPEAKPDLIILSCNSLKADEDIFLDDMTLDEFKKRLNIDVYVASDTQNMYRMLARRYLADCPKSILKDTYIYRNQTIERKRK